MIFFLRSGLSFPLVIFDNVEGRMLKSCYIYTSCIYSFFFTPSNFGTIGSTARSFLFLNISYHMSFIIRNSPA